MVPQIVLASLLLCVGAFFLYIVLSFELSGEEDLLIPVCILIFVSGVFYSRKLSRKMLVFGVLLLCVIGTFSYLWISGEQPGPPRIIANAGEDQTVKVNETIEFNASRSVVGCVGIAGTIFVDRSLLLWDFDDRDGIQVDATGLRVNHTYTTTGTYKVTLILVVLPGYPFEDIYGMDTVSLIITVIED